jgi:hypothetical protein
MFMLLLHNKKRKWHVSYGQLLPSLFFLAILIAAITLKIIISRPSASWLPRTLSVPSRDHIGINYYHESMGYLKRTDAEITLDLRQIRTVTDNIKVYHNPYISKTLPLVTSIIQQAKLLQMHVVWVENDDSTPLTDGNWSSYQRNVISDAAFAYQAGADEFLVGNEISIHANRDPGFSDTNLPLRIKQLAEDCKLSFPGPIGYEEGWYKSLSWQGAGLGPLSRIYFTLYEPWHVFKTESDHIASSFGNTAEIGEMSTMTTRSQLHETDEEWTRDLLRRYDYARQKGLIIWLFTFNEPDNAGFGLFQSPSDQPHAIWDYLRGNKVMTYRELIYDPSHPENLQGFSGRFTLDHGRLRSDAFADPVLATVPISNYVFRGVATPLAPSGSQPRQAMRLVVRYSDVNDYYFLNIEPAGKSIQLYSRQNGTETELGSAFATIHSASDYDFEIRINGFGSSTRLQVFWNMVKLFDLTDQANTNITAGSAGMKNSGIAGEISGISITDLEKSVKP